MSIEMIKTLLNKLVVLAVIAVLATGPSVAIAQESDAPLTLDVTLEDQGYDSDDTIHGVQVTRDYSVRWPEAWEVQPGNTFTLHFSHSPVLDPRSTMTVEFNGTMLESVLLTPENTDDASLDVALPGDLFDVGYNRLRLELYMGLDDWNCLDLDNPALWTTVHNTSAFHLSYTLGAPELNLSDFPAPFIDTSDLVENHVTFVLPDQPTPAELNAAVTISAKLGQLASWRNMFVHTLSETQARAPNTIMGDMILVGRADRLQTLRTATQPIVVWEDRQPVLVDSSGKPLPSEAGVLWEQLSPVEETAVMLVVTGATDEAVLTAARALADEATYPRLVGQLGIVLDVPEPPPSDMMIGQVITMEELGYDDRTAWGTREQSIGYKIPLPMTWQIRSEAAFDLHFAHSAIADPERSFLNILLNGTPVGSIRLTHENAEDSHNIFRLPAQVFRLGHNSLSVVSDMDFDEEHRDEYYYDCLAPDPKEAWLVIYASSQLNMPGGPTSIVLSLDDYPQAFVGPANLSGVAFVVPDSADNAIAHAAIQIAERLGYYAEGEALAPQVINAQTLESMAQPPDYQILVGRSTQNAAIARLNADLPQPFKPGTDEPEPVEALAQIAPPEGSVGYIQAVLTSDGHPRLIVTGTTDEGVLWASDALSDSDLLKELDGDLAIISAAGSIATAEDSTVSAEDIIATAEIRPAEERQPPQAPMPTIEQPIAPSRPTDWIKWLAAGLFALTFVILAIVAWPEAHQRWKARRRHGI